ncbi:adenine glycosylase [Frigoribacterium sp. Leaf263]|uniref:A/G-specific adenine glycosylase n=1 Tax=Frigoribacterium sp. Leaf263 TaxID=1736313 RepID=UPI0006F36000|nr:A/G-specific adenine glycosylase [Frigoribacterium sp. Leaf263]KQO82689.1 adenine glycosylase [Frigoribacterium sp. Leaf263]
MSISPAVSDWFTVNRRDLPWRRPGFPAWGTLVSEVMLQQTPVVRVVPRLERWLDRWPRPADLAASPASEAVRAWDRLGYPRRALALHAAAVAITERHGGVVPEDVPSLLALPGVGDYTARAVAVFAYGHRHPVVDTNVRRVLARAVEGLAEPWAPKASRDLPLMESQLPDDAEEARVASAGVMELGALVCTARSPSCDACPLLAQCAWVAAGRPAHVGPRLPGQARFAGSDRQVRGLIMAELRASDVPVTKKEIDAVWPEPLQRDRALAGLLRDGLAAGSPDEGYRLPD